MVDVGEDASPSWVREECAAPRAQYWRSPRAGQPIEPEFAHEP